TPPENLLQFSGEMTCLLYLIYFFSVVGNDLLHYLVSYFSSPTTIALDSAPGSPFAAIWKTSSPFTSWSNSSISWGSTSSVSMIFSPSYEKLTSIVSSLDLL